MRTGTSAPRLRISFTISKPFLPGSITSTITRSMLLSRAWTKPSSPSWARMTSCPSLRRLTRNPRAMARSSSMTRTRPMRRGSCSPIRSAGRGDLDAEGAAFSFLALHLDAAAVRLDDPLGDGEAEARALGVAREEVVRPVEALEDALALMRPDPDAVVRDLDGDGSVPAAPAAQADQLVRTGVLDRVVQEVEDRLRHGVAIDRHLRQAGVDLGLVGGPELLRAEDLLDVVEESAQIGPLSPQRLAAALQARPVEKLLHHAREPLRLVGQLIEAFLLLRALHAPLAEGLGEEANAGERGAQLVRDVGDEVRLQARELVGAAHLPDGQTEPDADAGVEEDEKRDVPGAVAEGEARGGVVAGKLGGERESFERRAERPARHDGRPARRRGDLFEEAPQGGKRRRGRRGREHAKQAVLAGKARGGEAWHLGGDSQQIDLRRDDLIGSGVDDGVHLALPARIAGDEEVVVPGQRGRAALGLRQCGIAAVFRSRHGDDERVAGLAACRRRFLRGVVASGRLG